jgi:hypothetical protein
MHFLFFVAVLVLCWLVYALLRTQKRMETELREIRKRCVGATGDAAVSSPALPALNSTEALQVSTAKITEGIQRLMALTT